MSQPELMTLKALVRCLGVDKAIVQQWRKAGIGPPRTIIGRRCYYSREQVWTWLRAAQ